MGRGVDSHTHLNHPRLHRPLTEVLHRARQARVDEMLVVGYDLASSSLAVEVASAHPGLWAAVGVHPHEAKNLDGAAIEQLRALAAHRRVVAIGETGLDFYRDLSPRHQQAEAFRRHLLLARELSLPLIVHCRQAQEEVLTIVGEESAEGCVWHCFDGTPDQARRAIAMGMYLGFAGRITYRGSQGIRQAAAEIPIDRLLLETDCPYLPPEPRRARDNEPASLPLVAQAVAAARRAEPEAIMAVSAENARRAFSLGRAV